jgi:hypothetical protein
MIEICDNDFGRVLVNPRFVISARVSRATNDRPHRLHVSLAEWTYDEDFDDGVKAKLKLAEIEEAVDKSNGGGAK